VRGPPARMSSPFTVATQRHSADAARGPALTAVSPLRFISKRLCAGDMRTGGPRTQPTPPARISSPFAVATQRHSADAARGPALTAVSPLRFISKRLCAGDMRTGGPRTQPTPPARISSPFTVATQRHSADAARGPALTAVSPLRFISKRLCAGDMRTGGPRTQPTPPARMSSPFTVATQRHSADAARGPALTAVSPLRFISKRLCAGDMRTGGPRTQLKHDS
jgi:hypothetical protein